LFPLKKKPGNTRVTTISTTGEAKHTVGAKYHRGKRKVNVAICVIIKQALTTTPVIKREAKLKITAHMIIREPCVDVHSHRNYRYNNNGGGRSHDHEGGSPGGVNVIMIKRNANQEWAKLNGDFTLF